MKIILFIYKSILSLRYNVKIIGGENLEHNGPVLLLPNHVALVDPQILITFLGKYLNISPLASEKYYNKPGIKQVMDLFGTIPIGEISSGASAQDVKNTFGKIIKGLELGKKILIYPSGQIYRQGFETIVGKQSVYNIAKMMPENTKVIGIRDIGLWGSMFSMAWDNGNTSIFKSLFKGIGIIFANFIFFVPKREVLLEIEDISEQIKLYKDMSLNEFNKYLESFYNKDGEQELRYIKHYFYKNDVKSKFIPEIITGSLKELSISKTYDLSEISEDIKLDIITKISQIKSIDINTINFESNLILNLFFDSLDLAEIKSYVQSIYKGASNPPVNEIKTVGDLLIMAVGKSENVEKLKDCDWGSINGNSYIIEKISNSGKTIPNLWKKEFSKNKNNPFLWDNILGMQTKKDFIIKAYLISSYIKKIPGDKIGIMLPSVGSASLLLMSTYLAGKIPVMFNWTLGKESFNHCKNFSGVDKILTSSNFYSKVKNDFLDEHNSLGEFVFIEDLLKNISTTDKIKALLKSFYLPIGKSIITSDIAVILFTSGSESLPKAVALTHENLIENIKGTLELFNVGCDDRLLGFLPPFHSFGFTINTILPLISGLQVVYTPDPNDAKTILDIIKHTNVTTITSTPTFLKMIMSLATKNDFKSIKYVAVGAEKCSDEVFNKFREICPKGKILEGYGITECSPVVTINPIDNQKKGTVGKIIPCLDCKIIDIDTGIEKNVLQQGMIYVSGKSIFNGYLDKNLESPFTVFNGKSYYKTGDLGFLDSDGYLTITGRLKRFIKIAGEMISLPFIESILLEKYGSEIELKIAIEAAEYSGTAKIYLFTIDHLELEEVNDYLRKRGVSNLVKISEIINIDEIPVLGSGKIDYKYLKSIVNQKIESIIVNRDLIYDFNNISDTIITKISEILDKDKSTINLDTRFGDELYFDSIDLSELVVFLRKNYNINGNFDIKNIKIVSDLVDLVKKMKK